MRYVIWSFEHNAWWGWGWGMRGYIMLEEVCMVEQVAEAMGPPTHRPYGDVKVRAR